MESGSRQGSGRDAPVQNSNMALGRNPQGGGSQKLGMKEGIQVECGEEKNGDGDPRVVGDVQDKPKMKPKVDRPGNLPTRWASLFGVKPSSKSSYPPVKIVSSLEKGS